MKNLFEHTSAPWIRYSSCEYKTNSNGYLYITVSIDAKPEMYRPMQRTEQLVIDVLNAGLAAMQAIPELIRIAADPKHEANRKEKHKTDAVYGWYRYNIRFALPVYDDKTGKAARHNIYSASMPVRHANDDRKYLYDILAIKKKRAARLSENTVR